jgi:hypothetical protein
VLSVGLTNEALNLFFLLSLCSSLNPNLSYLKTQLITLLAAITTLPNYKEISTEKTKEPPKPTDPNEKVSNRWETSQNMEDKAEEWLEEAGKSTIPADK